MADKAIITQGDGRVTMINVFTVRPEQREQLIEILSEGIRSVTSKQAGFISSTIHSSLDGTRVVNYAQWESREAYEDLFASTEMRDFMRHLEQKLRFARADAGAYEVNAILVSSTSE